MSGSVIGCSRPLAIWSWPSVSSVLRIDGLAQNDSTLNENPAGDGGRSVPAPWRPSFGPLNQRTDNLSTTVDPSKPADAVATTPSAALLSAQPDADSPQAQASGVVNAAALMPTPADSNSVVNADDPDQTWQRGLGQDARSASITRVSKTLSRLPNDAGQICASTT